MRLASSGGTAFPISLAIAASLEPLKTCVFEKVCNIAPSLKDIARGSSGCPNLPLDKLLNRVVIVGAGLFQNMRP